MYNLDRFHPFGLRDRIVEPDQNIGLRNYPQHNPWRGLDLFYYQTAFTCGAACGIGTVARQAFVGWPSLMHSGWDQPPMPRFGMRAFYLGLRSALIGTARGYIAGLCVS